ncbi:Mor transcription activator family protein [Paenibacillus sp. M1]|uniref:Mor transcription activator family protein n=1 Tax=Paenibacillus haidiansis TaxID=1574488 RepID=A0ABU7VQM4_9BACL
MEDWIKELTIDMIPEPYSSYAKAIGIENLIELVKLSGGDEIYLPTLDFFRRPIRDKRIREEYTGYNEKSLARKYELSERRIREIVEGEKPPAIIDENQFSLIVENGAFTWGTPSKNE